MPRKPCDMEELKRLATTTDLPYVIIAFRLGMRTNTIQTLIRKNGWRTRQRVTTPFEVKVQRLWESGTSTGGILKAFPNHTEREVNSILARLKLRGEGRFASLRSDIPPSRAMIALAAHDPVIARALRARLGQAEPTSEPSLG